MLTMDTTENQGSSTSQQYQKVYNDFQKFCKKMKKPQEISENVILEYFNEHSRSFKPTSLWAYYSMLKAKLKEHDNVDISNFHKVTTFLKAQSSGYVPAKAPCFTREQIERFLSDALDDVYLAVKVVCIFCVCGALTSGELTRISVKHVEKHGELYLVRIPHKGNKKAHVFTITGTFFAVVQKYISLRSPKTTENRFFVNYRNGKCSSQVIGKHRFAKMAAQVAAYLRLPEPQQYTGSAFKKSSIQNAKGDKSKTSTITSTAGTVSGTDSPLDSIAVDKCEPFDEDMCNTNESGSSGDWFSSQQVNYKTNNTTFDTRRTYKCEQCGHFNSITPTPTENCELPQVSVDPLSL